VPLARNEAAGQEHGDLSGDSCNVEWAPVVEGPHDDLFDTADDELGDDMGLKRPSLDSPAKST
jgi:hypothetical protein